MPIGFNVNDGFYIQSPTCECGGPLEETGCDAPGCRALACEDCGTGCDRGFPGSRCDEAAEQESDEDYTARVNAERAAFGLRPLSEMEG